MSDDLKYRVDATVPDRRTDNIVFAWGGPLATLEIDVDELTHFLEVSGRAPSADHARGLIARFIVRHRQEIPQASGSIESQLFEWLINQIDPRKGPPPLPIEAARVRSVWSHLRPYSGELRMRLTKAAGAAASSGRRALIADLWRICLRQVANEHKRLVLRGELNPTCFASWLLDCGTRPDRATADGRTLFETVFGADASGILRRAVNDRAVHAADIRSVDDITDRLAAYRLGASPEYVKTKRPKPSRVE